MPGNLELPRAQQEPGPDAPTCDLVASRNDCGPGPRTIGGAPCPSGPGRIRLGFQLKPTGGFARVSRLDCATLPLAESKKTRLIICSLLYGYRLPTMQATSVLFFSNASITGTNPSPNKRGLHCLSVSLTDRMDAA
jgi:hypothetical protein